MIITWISMVILELIHASKPDFCGRVVLIRHWTIPGFPVLSWLMVIERIACFGGDDSFLESPHLLAAQALFPKKTCSRSSFRIRWNRPAAIVWSSRALRFEKLGVNWVLNPGLVVCSLVYSVLPEQLRPTVNSQLIERLLGISRLLSARGIACSTRCETTSSWLLRKQRLLVIVCNLQSVLWCEPLANRHGKQLSWFTKRMSEWDLRSSGLVRCSVCSYCRPLWRICL